MKLIKPKAEHIGMKYKELLVVVREKQLNDLIAAYNALSNGMEDEVVRFGKCGYIHPVDYICPKCGNDPCDDEYPYAPVNLDIEVLERL